MLGWLNLCLVLFLHQEPDEPRFQARLEGLKSLLAEPQLTDREWRVAIWEHLTQLEHAPTAGVLPGWQALARSGLDADLANLYVYQRRHQLELLPVPADAGPELTLEHCLEAWARSDLPATRSRLEAALQRFPNDLRLQSNLDWLLGRAPERVELDGSARHLALVVLAARGPLS